MEPMGSYKWDCKGGVFILGFFVFCLGVCAVSRLSVPWLFGQVLAPWFPWLLGFSVSGLLGFLGVLAVRPLGLLASRLPIASCIILYYVILNYIK